MDSKINIYFKNKDLDTSFFNDDTLEEKIKMTSDVIKTICTNAP